MPAGKTNTDWIELQNNPDNWLDILEFDVLPMDVGFRGFSRPIVGPRTKDTAFHSAVREIISEVRAHAFKRFKSMADLQQINDAGMHRFESEIDSESVFISAPAGDELFVYRYDCIFAFLGEAVEAYSQNKKECVEFLSFATVEVAKMMTNAAADPKLLATVRIAMAGEGGRAKRDNDPKQKEKELVRECWDDWQKEPLENNGEVKYKDKTAFATDMLKECDHLKNHAVIVRWCSIWEQEAITLPAE